MLEEEIKRILSKEIRPMLAAHLGDVDFVSFEDGVVKLKLIGTCHGCPLANITLKEGIEAMLKDRLNGIQRVEAVE